MAGIDDYHMVDVTAMGEETPRMIPGEKKQKVSIITPWYNCPELIKTYEKSVAGADVIIIDNGSEPAAALLIKAMVDRLAGQYIRNEHNARYATANNQGLAKATGDVVIFMNNDIEAPIGWHKRSAIEVEDGALYGPSKQVRPIAGIPLAYIEGFCIGGTRATWDALNGWDDETYSGMYWEDNDLCWRALQMGYKLIETNWPVWHFSNYTSRNTEGSYDKSKDNYETFCEKVRAGSLQLRGG